MFAVFVKCKGEAETTENIFVSSQKLVCWKHLARRSNILSWILPLTFSNLTWPKAEGQSFSEANAALQFIDLEEFPLLDMLPWSVHSVFFFFLFLKKTFFTFFPVWYPFK